MFEVKQMLPIVPDKDDHKDDQKYQDDGQARTKMPAIDKEAGSGSGDPQ